METFSRSPTRAANLTQKPGVLQEANRLLAVERLLQQSLELELAQHCHVASWRNGILKILVDGATWNTQLRFQTAQLLNRLKPQLPTLQSIECRTVPQATGKETTYWQPTPISREVKEMLYYVSTGVTDEKLKLALARLAERARAR